MRLWQREEGLHTMHDQPVGLRGTRWSNCPRGLSRRWVHQRWSPQGQRQGTFPF